MNDIVTTNQGAQLPSNPQEMAEYYRRMAEETAATERSAGNTISVRNGIMSVGDQPIPGNQFAAVIMDSIRLNTFFPSAFNANSIEPPVCYALGRNDAELAPHPDMWKSQEAQAFFKPQSQYCNACPHNEFGSGRTGTGKACTNRRRIVLLLAGTYNMTAQGLVLSPYMEADHYASTPFLQMHLPPTSIKGWGEFVRSTAAQYQRPPSALVTRIYLYPHPTHGKEAIGFEALGPTPDAWFSTIMGRMQEAANEAFKTYEPPQQRHPGGGFYGQQNQQQGA